MKRKSTITLLITEIITIKTTDCGSGVFRT
jgi:hypothetical protein